MYVEAGAQEGGEVATYRAKTDANYEPLPGVCSMDHGVVVLGDLEVV
jgi:hypothetical protein